MTETEPMSTASHLTRALRRHYLPEGKMPGGLFIDEIASPDGGRRADALWIPTSIAGRTADTIIGHEIKVTRADIRTELADPTKADPWLQYCTRWWLVILTPAMIDGLDIPEIWGIMAPPSGRRTRTMTVIREAPRLKPERSDGMVANRLAGYFLHRMNAGVSDHQQQNELLRRENQQLRQKIDALRTMPGDTRPSPEAERLKKIIDRVRYLTNRESCFTGSRDEDIIDAIVDDAIVKRNAQLVQIKINRTIGELERVTQPLGEEVRRLRIVQDLSQHLFDLAEADAEEVPT